MPELPEVEAVCRLLRPQVCGRVIRSVEVLRSRCVTPSVAPPSRMRNRSLTVAARMSSREFGQRLRGSQIVRLQRRGKNLIFHLSPRPRLGAFCVLLVHLRMSGNLYSDFTNRPGPSGTYVSRPLPHGRGSDDSTRRALPPGTCLVFHLAGGGRMILEDRRGLAVCRLLTVTEAAARLAKVGLEPLSPRFTARKLLEMTCHCPSPIKIFLMDQRHVAGLGNIYAAEALFRAGIHPLVRAASLSPNRAQKLHMAIVSVLKGAVKSALRGYRRPGVFSSQEEFELQVYGREGQACRNCGGAIRRMKTRSRSTFYCPHCQKNSDE